MTNTDFLSELRQQTENDVLKLKELTTLLKTTKQQIKFLEKRIASSNDMLSMGGQKPVKTED